MAGFWHLSHHQMRDRNGNILAGAKVYFYEASTLNPITVYQDYGLGTAHPNPVVANGYGVFPPVFFDESDGFYRQRVTSSGGVIIPGTDVGTLPIIGPSGGSGGSEVPVDTNALFKTGDTKWLDITGSLSGWVRDNGRTIGNAVSGASERANADCEALYAWYWQNFSNTLCPVTGGRGANAAADWAAGKPIATRDRRGRSAFGLDDMGSAAAGRITGGTSAGASGGVDKVTLTEPQLPVITPQVNETAHSHNLKSLNTSPYQFGGNGWGFANSSGNFGSGNPTSQGSTDPVKTNITVSQFGGGESHDNMPPYDLGTWYRKL